MKAIQVIGKFFGTVFRLFTGGATKAARVIQKVTEEALPVVEAIAALTPTRTDDELVAAFRRFGVPLAKWWLTVPQDERGGALLELATQVLLQKFPTGPIHQIQAGVQLALALNRSGAGVAGMVTIPPETGETR